MHAPALWKWVLLRQIRNPVVGALAVFLLVGCPLLWSLRILPTGEGLADLASPWHLQAGLLGASLGLASLSADQAFLSRLAPRTRWAGELGALALASAYLQVPIFLGMLLCGVALSDLGPSSAAILTCDLHLAGLAQLLLLPALSTATRVTLLIAGVWVVPALVTPISGFGRVLVLLDADRALRVSTPVQLLPELTLAVCLALMGFLLRTPAPGRERA